MTDLISRADAIKAVSEDVMGGLNYERILQSLPSAEAEPIVYCMDCEKSVPLDEHGALWYCNAHDRTMLRHSYCDNGERKEESEVEE